ncbi:hypothetical protein MOQ_004656 [Trypanosoma cruzi marinkellei]|uniref:Uncharacterized protein n=1 Tax=Trypanosoma cruzi marinkellei TaxID=85056 RepID=K2M8Y0_TRYCR|nr:hypothetical protein MOQ_004656 [Trypanosoma cruzi marinkellei]
MPGTPGNKNIGSAAAPAVRLGSCGPRRRAQLTGLTCKCINKKGAQKKRSTRLHKGNHCHVITLGKDPSWPAPQGHNAPGGIKPRIDAKVAPDDRSYKKHIYQASSGDAHAAGGPTLPRVREGREKSPSRPHVRTHAHQDAYHPPRDFELRVGRNIARPQSHSYDGAAHCGGAKAAPHISAVGTQSHAPTDVTATHAGRASLPMEQRPSAPPRAATRRLREETAGPVHGQQNTPFVLLSNGALHPRSG